MYLENGWQQIEPTKGARDYRKAYKNKDNERVLELRLYENWQSWRLKVTVYTVNRGINIDYPIVYGCKLKTKDVGSMMNEAEDIARSFLTELHSLIESAVDCLPDI